MKWVKSAVLTAVGALLYFLVGRLVHFPVLLGFTIHLEVAVLALAAVLYGPFIGFATAALGEVLLAATGGAFWWSVIAAACLAGFATGFLANGSYRKAGGFSGRAMVAFVLGTVLAHTAAWVVVCPALDWLFYGEALDNILMRGAAEAISNVFVSMLGGGFLILLLGWLLPWQKQTTPGGGAFFELDTPR